MSLNYTLNFIVINYIQLFWSKLRVWSLSFTPYFNLIPNLSIVLIWSQTFQWHVNLVSKIIFFMEIDDMNNSQKNKISFH